MAFKNLMQSKDCTSATFNTSFNNAQILKDNRPIGAVQKKQVSANTDSFIPEIPTQRKENSTGLPDNLKSGIENLSGHSLDDVKVHFNSSQPAQLNAHAYAQGNQIHVAPGQEKHLPHEAWHVVQQKEGRVKPTLQLKGKVNINDDSSLEKEADVMGAKAVSTKQALQLKSNKSLAGPLQTIQLATSVKYTSNTVKYTDYATNTSKNAIVGSKMTSTLDPGDQIKGSEPGTGGTTDELYVELNKNNPAGYGAHSFVRGHLLNAHLGGLGVAENLFPITTAANHAHVEHAENPVKALVFNGNTVSYDVTMTRSGVGDFRLQPNATIKAEASVGGSQLINVTIPSIANKGNTSLNDELTNKGFGKHGSGDAPGFNDWIIHGLGARYIDKATLKVLADTDRQTIV